MREGKPEMQLAIETLRSHDRTRATNDSPPTVYELLQRCATAIRDKQRDAARARSEAERADEAIKELRRALDVFRKGVDDECGALVKEAG